MTRERATQILATIGPASRGHVEALVRAGIDVARLNYSHGSHDEHAAVARSVRLAAERVGRTVTILADLEGPKLRLGALPEAVDLERGDRLVLARDGDPATRTLPVAEPRLLEALEPGDRVFLADGAVELEITSSDGGRVQARVVTGSRVRSRAGIVVRDRDLGLPALDDDDLDDVHHALDLGAEAIAQSMVSRAADVEALRAALPPGTRIVAKIETAAAVEAIDEIAAAADAIMVARGDLGVAIDRHRVPLVQKDLLAAARRAGRPGIVATELMLRMVEHPRPSRAEVSDVVTALFDGASAVMLSEETAIGVDPVRVVDELRRILETVEASTHFAARLR